MMSKLLNGILAVVLSLCAGGCGGLDPSRQEQLNASVQSATACAPGQSFVASARVYPGSQLVTNVCVTVTGGGHCTSGNYAVSSGLDFCVPSGGGSSFPASCAGNWNRYGISGIDLCGYVGACEASHCSDGSCCPPTGVCKNGIACQL